MIDVEITRAQIARAPRSEISGILSCVYGALAAGEITEDEAAVLEAAGNLRRSLPPAPPPARKVVGSRPRTSASIARRRRWAASSRLPPALAEQFTPSETGVLALIAAEVARHGDCRLAVEHMAAVVGTCATVVRSAIREARRLGLLSVEERRRAGRRNDTNILQIVSALWAGWLRLGRRGSGGGAFGFAKATHIQDLKSDQPVKIEASEPVRRLPRGSDRRQTHSPGQNRGGW